MGVISVARVLDCCLYVKKESWAAGRRHQSFSGDQMTATRKHSRALEEAALKATVQNLIRFSQEFRLERLTFRYGIGSDCNWKCKSLWNCHLLEKVLYSLKVNDVAQQWHCESLTNTLFGQCPHATHELLWHTAPNAYSSKLRSEATTRLKNC